MFENTGHGVTLNWPVLPMVKPIADNPVKSGEFASSAIDAIIAADIYVLFAHEDGGGVFTELGAALAVSQSLGKLRLFAIAESVLLATFHYHPLITWVKSLDDVLAKL